MGWLLDLTYGLTPVSAPQHQRLHLPPRTGLSPPPFTASGAGVFSYLNAANPVIVKNAYTYLSRRPMPVTQTVPLLMAD